MEEYKRIFAEKHKLNSLVACTLSLTGDQGVRDLVINKSYISPETANGLHMMSDTYLYTNPPPYGHGSPAPYVAATVLRAHEYNHKNEQDSIKYINNFEIIDTAIPDLKSFPRNGIIGNYNPSLVWGFAQHFLIKKFGAISKCVDHTIDYIKKSNSDVLSKGRQTWNPETLRSTTCSKAFTSFLNLFKRNLNKVPSTLIEVLIFWYELYSCPSLLVKKKHKKVLNKKKFVRSLKIRFLVSKTKFYVKDVVISGSENCHKWLDDYARSFCSYIKHAERRKKDRRAIASGSLAMRLHLKIIEEFHLKLSKMISGSTISIGGEEKKRKITSELQTSSLKEGFTECYSLQATEDATKWNECLNPTLFALVHNCWFDDKLRLQNNLPPVTDNQKTFGKICRMGFYYLLIKRIHLGIGFVLNNDHFYTRLNWNEIKPSMLNPYNRIWFEKIADKIDDDDYISSSPGFLMGMLNAASTTMGLIAIGGVEIPNTLVRSLRSSDDSMTVFVANSILSLSALICIIYSVYRLFGINPSKEKTILFPEAYGEYTSWYQDNNFVGQYGVETSSLKPMGKNPQDDFNSVAANTLQLMRTHIINVMGAMSRLSIGIDNVRRLWNVSSKRGIEEKKELTGDVIFLADGGRNTWTPENLAVDESTIRFNNIQTKADREYFLKIMDPGNPFSEPAEEQLLFSKDVGVLVSHEDHNPRNVFCYIRRGNRTNKSESSVEDAKFERANQEAFEIVTSIDPSFLLTIPNSKVKLSKYLSSTLFIIKEKIFDSLSDSERNTIDSAISRLSFNVNRVDDKATEYDFYDNI